MIVVSVGTNEARFDRLLDWISRHSTEEEVVVQHGPSAVRREGATSVPYMPYEELVGLVRSCRVFVTHAGVGSIMVSLSAGRRPIVVPRLKAFGEAVDDHQLPLARRLQDEGLVTLAASEDELNRALATRDHTISRPVGATGLRSDLRGYLVELRSARPASL